MKLIFLWSFLIFIKIAFSLYLDDSFSIEESLYQINWIEHGASSYENNLIKLITDFPEQASMIKPKHKIHYNDSFYIDIKLNITKNNKNLSNYGDGVALWLLREDPSYTKINYTLNNALLYGNSGAYKGLGIFIVPNNTNNSNSTILGKENTKVFKFTKEGIFINSRLCEIDLTKPIEIRLSYEDFLFVYIKNPQTQRNELCFNLAENYEVVDKEFFFSITASTSKEASFAVEISSIKLFSDAVAEENKINITDEEKENLKKESEVNIEDISVIQEQIKNILLIQVEQMKKLQHIKHYNALSLKDMKNDIKDITFFQKLLNFEIDVRLMASILETQKEKIDELMQLFENFGNQTGETLASHEQIKKRDNERITYFENFLTDFENKFNSLEISLMKSLQEKENLISKINAVLKNQKELQENQDVVMNSITNNIEMTKFYLETEKNEFNWTNYVTIFGVIGIIIISLILLQRLSGLKQHWR